MVVQWNASSAAEPANVASVSIGVQLIMLSLTFILGHLLRRKKIMVAHEAGAALLLGVLVGLVVKFFEKERGFKEWINFNNSFFFYFLLPPIIFESGWSLRLKPFFNNFGAICVFAFGGTLISTFCVGILIYLFGQLKWTYSMPFLVCLTFGALISATDPVTVLAIFHELGADSNLYAYVFGESVLNDAVAIVMYKTVLSFITSPISNKGVLEAVSFFVAIFVGSFSIGVLAGMLSALLFKYGGFQEKGLSILESCLAVLFPYFAYNMADALELSGIVSILFAGITMKYYTAPNLSSEAQQITTGFFGMLAKLSETFVFIYMGVATFLEQQSWNNIGFTFFTIISILIARLCNVYPCSVLVNHFRERPKQIPKNHQHALWFSGLRGAMAFALALHSVTDLPNNHGRVLLTTTLLTIFFTVLFIGGSTSIVLKLLKIKCLGPGKEEEQGEDSLEGEPEFVLDMENVNTRKKEGLPILIKQRAEFSRKLKKLKADTSFTTLDKKYLKPFLQAASDAVTDKQDQQNKKPDGINTSDNGIDEYEYSETVGLLRSSR